MPNLTITKSYTDGDLLFEADLDNIRNDLLTFFNNTKIDAINIQDGSIGGVNLDPGIVDDVGIEKATNTFRLKDLGVTSAKLADAIVTRDKYQSAYAESSEINFTTSSTSAVDVTNSRVNCTASHNSTSPENRPTLIALVPSANASAGTPANIFFEKTSGPSASPSTDLRAGGTLELFEDVSTKLTSFVWNFRTPHIVTTGINPNFTNSQNFYSTPVVVWLLPDTKNRTFNLKLSNLSAGSFTSTTATITNCKLIAVEL
jgi:hypothetical protein